jgi:hypothetical protein
MRDLTKLFFTYHFVFNMKRNNFWRLFTATPQHRNTATPQHRNTATPQHRAAHRLQMLLLMFLTFFGSPLLAQEVKDQKGSETECANIGECNDLSLRIRLVHNLTGVECPTIPSEVVCDFDPTCEVIYRVDLIKKNTIIDPESFEMFYRKLQVGVNLEHLLGSSMISRIDKAKTEKCYLLSHPDNPDNGVIVDSEVSASINLTNNEVPCPTSDIIIFTKEDSEDPGNAPALVYTLFYVVVDAHPGETIQLTCAGNPLFEGGGGVICDNFNTTPTIPTSGAFNSCDVSPPVTIALPAASTQSILASSISITSEQSALSTNGKEIRLFASNSDGFSPYNPSYVEFVSDLVFTIPMQEPEVTIMGVGPNNFHEVEKIGNSNMHWRYRFFISPGNIPAAVSPNPSKVQIAKFVIKGPLLENQCWSVNVEFPFPASSRIKSMGSPECVHNLKVPLAPIPYPSTSLDCADKCSSTGSDLNFHAEIIPATSCSDSPKIRVVMTADPSATGGVRFWGIDLVVFTGMSDGLYYGDAIPDPRFICTNTNLLNCSSFPNGIGKYRYYMLSDNSFYINYASALVVFEFPLTGVGCVSEARISSLTLILDDGNGGVVRCIPDILATVGDPTCNPMLMGKIQTEELGPDDGVEEVTVMFEEMCENIVCTIDNQITDNHGQFNQCNFSQCSTCKQYKITPFSNQDPKNGVTTYDLLLISRHILGLEPLDSPYKMIAADVNKSNTITTFDIVEGRKLILGLYSEFPNAPSWRFIDKTYQFSNNQNPFIDVIGTTNLYKGESIEVESTDNIDLTYDFIGIKMGDLNLSAVTNNRPLLRPNTQFGWLTAQKQTGKYVTVPVQYFGTDPLLACQMGFLFDPQKLRLLTPSSGDIEGVGPDNFGLTEVENGKIRFVWLAPQLDPERMLLPGQTTFNLTFEVLGDLPENGIIPLVFEDNVLDNAVWNGQDIEYHIEAATDVEERQSVSSNVPSVVQIICTPNPTKGIFELTITPQMSGKARVGLFDNNGRMIQLMNIELVVGQQQTILLNGLEKEPSGVYTWKVFNSAFKEQGQIIKQ